MRFAGVPTKLLLVGTLASNVGKVQKKAKQNILKNGVGSFFLYKIPFWSHRGTSLRVACLTSNDPSVPFQRTVLPYWSKGSGK